MGERQTGECRTAYANLNEGISSDIGNSPAECLSETKQPPLGAVLPLSGEYLMRLLRVKRNLDGLQSFMFAKAGR